MGLEPDDWGERAYYSAISSKALQPDKLYQAFWQDFWQKFCQQSPGNYPGDDAQSGQGNLPQNYGAISSFTGVVRSQTHQGQPLSVLELVHYPAMSAHILQDYLHKIARKWQLGQVWAVHRVGKFCPGTPIMMVLTAASHRQAAQTACNCLVDIIKSQVPLWKCEYDQQGKKYWCDPHPQDQKLGQKWLAELAKTAETFPIK